MFDIQRKAASITAGKALDRVSGVILHTGLNDGGEETTYFSGNSSGYVLELDCPTGSQQIADAICSSLKARGFRYQPVDATRAIIDPACEIGDNIAANGVNSIIFSRANIFSKNMRFDVSAPYDEEVDHEFTFKPRSEREFKRESAYARSRITQTQAQISLEVIRATNSEAELSSRITMTADAITSEVTRATKAEGNLGTKIEQRLDGVTISATSESGTSTFTIKDGSTTLSTQTLDLSVKAVNISGTLTIGQLDSTTQGKINGAVKRSCMIYYSSATNTTPAAPTAWVSTTAASDETWTQGRPEYSQSYKYLYTCRQTESEDGTYSCTSPRKDYTTTVIDGANIITGSITANKLSVTDLYALGATIGGWTIEGGTNSRISKTTDTARVRLNAFPNTTDATNAIVIATKGAADPESSFSTKFYVTYGGKLYAKNAEIDGKITATSGVIGGLTINNSGDLTGITDTNISTGGITGGVNSSGQATSSIAAGTIGTGNVTSGINTSLGYGTAYGSATASATADGPTYFNAYDIRARHALSQAGYGFTRKTVTVRNSAGTGTVTLNFWSWGD